MADFCSTAGTGGTVARWSRYRLQNGSVEKAGNVILVRSLELVGKIKSYSRVGSSRRLPQNVIRYSAMQIRPFQADDGLLMKELRLRCLIDAPYAFGGTKRCEEESALHDAHWHQLAAEVGGEVPAWKDRCVSYVVLEGAKACGTASSYLCSRVPRRAYFSAAWIDPHYRRRGIGRNLVEMAKVWALAHGADHLKLWVDDANPDAATFYRALGFSCTGENRPRDSGSPERETSYILRLTAAG
jgi:GNAT superfamily N-acetyltransferase